MKQKWVFVLGLSILSGLFLSLAFVNPYSGKITLAEMVLQLSGSRGELPLGLSFAELSSFALCLLPAFLLEFYVGMQIYRHFCTASVYVFSRYPFRRKWFLNEAFRLYGIVFIFYLFSTVAVMLFTSIRFQLHIDYVGIKMMIYHICIYSYWIYIISMVMNILALYLGSSMAYSIIMIVQLASIVGLNLMNSVVKFSGIKVSYGDCLFFNPIAHIVLGWHLDSPVMKDVIDASYLNIELKCSLFIFIILAVFLTCAGICIMDKYEIFTLNLEEEGY